MGASYRLPRPACKASGGDPVPALNASALPNDQSFLPAAPNHSHDKPRNPAKGPTMMAALAGVVSAAVVLAVAELIGAFFTARATPVFALDPRSSTSRRRG